jgi:AhpD family alkylhydroperoxidase
MALLRSLPENATLADLRCTYADLLEKLRPYGHRLMRGPSPLSPGERELIAAFVSGVNSCRYCHGAHSLVARSGELRCPQRAHIAWRELRRPGDSDHRSKSVIPVAPCALEQPHDLALGPRRRTPGCRAVAYAE